jgi:hypothetical protein
MLVYLCILLETICLCRINCRDPHITLVLRRVIASTYYTTTIVDAMIIYIGVYVEKLWFVK